MNRSKHMKEENKKTLFAGWDDSRLLPPTKKREASQPGDNFYKTQAVQVSEGLEDLLPGNNTLQGYRTLGDMNYNYLRNQYDKYLWKKRGEATVEEVNGYTSHELMYTMLGLGSKRPDDGLATINHNQTREYKTSDRLVCPVRRTQVTLDILANNSGLLPAARITPKASAPENDNKRFAGVTDLASLPSARFQAVSLIQRHFRGYLARRRMNRIRTAHEPSPPTNIRGFSDRDTAHQLRTMNLRGYAQAGQLKSESQGNRTAFLGMGKKELLLTARKEMALPKSKGLKIIEVLSKDHPKKGLINLDKLDWTVEESRRSQIRRSPRRKDHRISKSNLNVSSYIDGTVSNDFEDHIGLRMNTDTTNKNSVLEDESIPENLAVSQSQSVRRRSSRRRARGQAESEEDEEEESSGFGFIKQERANQPAVGQKKREETQAEEEESNPFGVVRRPAEAKPSAQVPEPQRPATQKRPALKTGESLSEEREHRGGIRNFVYGLDPEIYSEAVPERKDGRAERTDGGQGRTQVIGEVRQVLARMRRDASEVTEAIEGVGSADQYLQREAKSRTEAKSEWLRCLEEDQDYTKKFVNKVRAMRNDTLHLANFEKLVDNLLEARELASVEERVKVDGKNQKEGSVACNFKGGDTIKARINEKVEELRSKALSEYQRNQGYPGEEALGDLNELENRLRGEMKAIFAMEESLDPETAMLEAQKRINRLKRLDLLLKEVRQSNDERFEALKQNELIKKRKERARMEAGAAGGRGKTAVEDSALMGDYGESQEGLSDISWVELGSASQLRRG